MPTQTAPPTPDPAQKRGRLFLHWAPALTLTIMLGPILAGTLGTLLPALGYLPALGGDHISLDPLRHMLAWPGLPQASFLSVFVGGLSAILALLGVVILCAALDGSRAFRFVERTLSPLLSIPHAAAAFGLAFLIAPSGWLVRVFSPWATGWQTPPDLLILQDSWGFSLVAGLVTKEIPFLLLMTLAAYPQIRKSQALAIAATTGYTPLVGWCKTVFPQLYTQIRLPVFAVLAYSMTVIDVAIILGPNTPLTLSVQVLRWMNDPDLAMRFAAAAGAVLQLILVIGALLVWRVGEVVVARLGRYWLASGHRGRLVLMPRVLALALAGAVFLAITLGIAGQIVWSFAGFWGFPDVWPKATTLRTWSGHGSMVTPVFLDTLLIGAAATFASLVMVLACLEAEFRYGFRPGTRALWLLYLPLIAPQITFLTGLQTLSIYAGIDGNHLAVIATHVVFVLPYVFLSLSGPFRSWDPRFSVVAETMGASRDRVFWSIRMPMMIKAILTASAVGCAVSIGQYLPTLLAGAGRVQTLTTEAVALASGGNRRVIAVYSLAQTVAAFLPFALALAIPAVMFRNRRGLRDG